MQLGIKRKDVPLPQVHRPPESCLGIPNWELLPNARAGNALFRQKLLLTV